MSMTVPILIVLYNPSAASLRRINSVIEQRPLVFIFDNSPSSVLSLSTREFYMHCPGNGGIVAALNWMTRNCERFRLQGFLFFDQDTKFDDHALTTIEALTSLVVERAGLIHFSSTRDDTDHALFVINSGTWFYAKPLVDALRVIDRRYWVDAVDLAICLHFRRSGLPVWVRRCVGIDHESEQGYRQVDLGAFLSLQIKPVSVARRIEFYRGHFTLLIDCLRWGQVKDFITVLKFVIRFSVPISAIRRFCREP